MECSVFQILQKYESRNIPLFAGTRFVLRLQTYIWGQKCTFLSSPVLQLILLYFCNFDNFDIPYIQNIPCFKFRKNMRVGIFRLMQGLNALVATFPYLDGKFLMKNCIKMLNTLVWIEKFGKISISLVSSKICNNKRNEGSYQKV